MKIPTLPEPNTEFLSGHRDPIVSFDADHMREYGKLCAEKMREECATQLSLQHTWISNVAAAQVVLKLEVE